MNNTLKLIVSIVVPFLAAFIGNLATIPNIPTWYEMLEKPLLNPPNYIFGPVWTILYLCMGLALYLVWTAKSKEGKRQAYGLFAVQLVLNTLWSLVFFGLHQPWLALCIIIALWAAIFMTLREFGTFSKYAKWLLVPYIVWVSFALYLNGAIAVLN